MVIICHKIWSLDAIRYGHSTKEGKFSTDFSTKNAPKRPLVGAFARYNRDRGVWCLGSWRVLWLIFISCLYQFDIDREDGWDICMPETYRIARRVCRSDVCECFVQQAALISVLFVQQAVWCRSLLYVRKMFEHEQLHLRQTSKVCTSWEKLPRRTGSARARFVCTHHIDDIDYEINVV